MFRLKAENFAIAVGILVLYLVMPPLTYDIRQSTAQPLVKRHTNEWLLKFDPETESVVERPVLIVTTGRPVEAPTRILTYMPYLSSPGGRDAVAAVPAPTEPEPPTRLVIPAIKLDAPVIPAKSRVIRVEGEKVRQWLVPNEFAAGWHKNTARLGEPGNTVINGHHNVYGEVFVRLVDLAEGDVIEIYSETRVYRYIVANKMILPEIYQDLDTRMENAQWILPSEDERVTLITCWPYESNTHRLVIVARPIP